MSSRFLDESWVVLDQRYENPTWAECYAVYAADTDGMIPEDTDPPVAATESELDE